MRKKRALWLINHITLRPFEVPMLIDMGYEVYCSKQFPRQEGNMSANIVYEYDSTLSIPQDVIEELNKEDLYENVSDHILEILNEYFDIVFVSFFPNQLRMLINGFEGIIVMQPFGLDGTKTYTEVIEASIGKSYLDKIEEIGNRFYFGQAYENLAEIESNCLKRRAIYLPIGLKNAEVNRKWVGGEKKILFVCPRIETNSYYNAIYNNFKKEFKDFEYLIGGAQPIKVNDSNVLGYLPQEQYDYNMKHIDVMFYHSQEERHLHYHPLEAVKNGMPLIYMQGGLLEKIAGRKLAGACDSYDEARKKIRKIFSGDKRFIKKVIDDQEVLLTPFKYEYCRQHWEEALKEIEKSETFQIKNNTKKKIGVLLTESYLGGVLDFTIRFIKCLKWGIDEYGDNVELVFGYKESKLYDNDNYFEELERLGISVRKFKWKLLDSDFVETARQYGDFKVKSEDAEYCVPDDGIANFEDCDYLIFSVDRLPARYYPFKPYIVVVHDYIQRYLPEMMTKEYKELVFKMQHDAEKVLVMSEPTRQDAINYAGISENKVGLIPLMFDWKESKLEIENKEYSDNEKYFLWATNITKHKNHERIINALVKYYDNGGNMKCYMTGAETDKFVNDSEEDENEYVSKIRELIKDNPILQGNLIICGLLQKSQYYKLLKGASFFFHGGLIDNGNMATLDAAMFHVPTVSSRYPAMVYYEDTMNLGIKFFDPWDTDNIASSIAEMEKECDERARNLPSREVIKSYTIKSKYMDVYRLIKNTWGL